MIRHKSRMALDPEHWHEDHYVDVVRLKAALGIDESLPVRTKRSSAPSDSELSNGEVAIWIDPTPGSAKLMIKAKDSEGTVVTGEVVLT